MGALAGRSPVGSPVTAPPLRTRGPSARMVSVTRVPPCSYLKQKYFHS